MTPDRVEMNEPGADHPTQLGYYGGPYDGRYVRLEVMDESALWMISVTANDHPLDYAVTRYGVHSDTGTLCWVLLMFNPIFERGKL